ncbi:hypothetical protein LCGC14_1926570 [marine sediment metagenome]|uniref:Uncharacterized protein n=1 Tax=marine sediment metagenome TaxID=412755 RepID=A0A0F9GCP7_9ZZZZ
MSPTEPILLRENSELLTRPITYSQERGDCHAAEFQWRRPALFHYEWVHWRTNKRSARKLWAYNKAEALALLEFWSSKDWVYRLVKMENNMKHRVNRDNPVSYTSQEIKDTAPFGLYVESDYGTHVLICRDCPCESHIPATRLVLWVSEYEMSLFRRTSGSWQRVPPGWQLSITDDD